MATGVSRQAILRKLVLGTLLCLTPLVLLAALPASEVAGVSYRMRKIGFKVPMADGAPARKIELAYPVFLSGEASSRKRLNQWLRQTAWATVWPGDEAALLPVLNQSDRQLIKLRVPSAPAVHQTLLRPASALGALRTFTLATTRSDVPPPLPDVAVLVYKLRDGQSVTLESLFHPQAGAELAALFDAAKIKGYPACTSRHFDWRWASILGPHQVSLEFPHDPAQIQDCGDGSYNLKGKRIQALLKSPSELVPEHRLVEITDKSVI